MEGHNVPAGPEEEADVGCLCKNHLPKLSRLDWGGPEEDDLKSQNDQVVTISSHFAIGDILSKDITLPEEMGGFVAYTTPATSYSRSQSILPREVGWSGWNLVDWSSQKILNQQMREVLHAG